MLSNIYKRIGKQPPLKLKSATYYWSARFNCAKLSKSAKCRWPATRNSHAEESPQAYASRNAPSAVQSNAHEMQTSTSAGVVFLFF